VASACFKRQRLRAIEYGDVVETEKSALEDIVSVAILAVDPPGVIQQQLLKDPVQEMEVAGAALHPLGAEDLECCRRVDGRVHVTEGPFIGRDLAIRVQVSLAQQDFDLILGEIDVDQRQRAAMERKVPCGKPRILPAVGHRDDIARLEVLPIAVPAAESALRRRKPIAL